MRLPTILSALLAATAHLASASDAAGAARTAAIYIQPLTSPATPPFLLAEIAIPEVDTTTTQSPAEENLPTTAEILSYAAPDLPDYDEDHDDKQNRLLLRIGIYDPSSKTWLSSTSLASANNFAKGYSPHFVLSLDTDGHEVLGVVCRGVAIDAGLTRDFGPQAAVVRTRRGAQPVLGKPVVLGEGGKRVVEEERSFLQKYWWVLAIGAFLLFSGGDQK